MRSDLAEGTEMMRSARTEPDAATVRSLNPPALPSGLAELGAVVLLMLQVVRRVCANPLGSWSEATDQAWLLVSRCVLPAALSTFAFAYGSPGIEGGAISSILGAPDRIGAFFSLGAVREFVPWVTGMVVAGVAGTAITADLGARRTREELDAMAVMGVDPVRSLIAPRVLAMTLLMPAMNMIGIVCAAAAGLLAEFTYHGTAAGYFAQFKVGFFPLDLGALLVKTLAFGFITGIICAYKGYHAEGGPEGVGRAVNQAVLATFVALWVFNFTFNATYQAAFPTAAGAR